MLTGGYISDEIRSTPEKLDKLMGSKHVLSAAKLLIKSLRAVHSKDMKEIGALDDLRRTLTTQKNASIWFERQHLVCFLIRHCVPLGIA